MFQSLVGSTYVKACYYVAGLLADNLADCLVSQLANHLVGYFGFQLVGQDTSSDTIDLIITIEQIHSKNLILIIFLIFWIFLISWIILIVNIFLMMNNTPIDTF